MIMDPFKDTNLFQLHVTAHKTKTLVTKYPLVAFL